MVGAAPVNLAEVEAAVQGHDGDAGSFRACATDVQEWLVSDGVNWVLDGALTTTAAAPSRTPPTTASTAGDLCAAGVVGGQNQRFDSGCSNDDDDDGGGGGGGRGLVEECQRVPSGHVGGGVETFG